MSEETPLVQLSGVMKTYRESGDAPATQVLNGVDLTVLKGESVAIVGPSGSGKSTLLNIIGTLDRPTSGSVRIRGNDVTSMTDDAMAALRFRSIGLIFQLHHLLPQCTVFENVMIPTLAGARERVSEQPRARAERLLRRIGLSDRMNYRPGQLSGGERQRVAVVRALINEPELLLADEPTGALDQSSAENLAELLKELNREEAVALVVITHSMALAERMGKIYEIAEGRLQAISKPFAAAMP